MRVDIPWSTPDTVVDELKANPPNLDPPVNEALEVIQVVTEPTITAMDEATTMNNPIVTPGAGRADGAVVVGRGA
jgi:hypothetical protein